MGCVEAVSVCIILERILDRGVWCVLSTQHALGLVTLTPVEPFRARLIIRGRLLILTSTATSTAIPSSYHNTTASVSSLRVLSNSHRKPRAAGAPPLRSELALPHTLLSVLRWGLSR